MRCCSACMAAARGAIPMVDRRTMRGLASVAVSRGGIATARHVRPDPQSQDALEAAVIAAARRGGRRALVLRFSGGPASHGLPAILSVCCCAEAVRCGWSALH